MTKTIEFFKQDNLWYADVPNRTLDENEMVEGADTLLEFLADGHDRVALIVNTTATPKALMHLKMIHHNECGATYCMGPDPEDTVWLCNVTHDVFDEHPENLYITNIKAYTQSEKAHFFAKIFGSIRKKQYLCGEFTQTT